MSAERRLVRDRRSNIPKDIPPYPQRQMPSLQLKYLEDVMQGWESARINWHSEEQSWQVLHRESGVIFAEFANDQPFYAVKVCNMLDVVNGLDPQRHVSTRDCIITDYLDGVEPNDSNRDDLLAELKVSVQKCEDTGRGLNTLSVIVDDLQTEERPQLKSHAAAYAQAEAAFFHGDYSHFAHSPREKHYFEEGDDIDGCHFPISFSQMQEWISIYEAEHGALPSYRASPNFNEETLQNGLEPRLLKSTAYASVVIRYRLRKYSFLSKDDAEFAVSSSTASTGSTAEVASRLRRVVKAILIPPCAEARSNWLNYVVFSGSPISAGKLAVLEDYVVFEITGTRQKLKKLAAFHRDLLHIICFACYTGMTVELPMIGSSADLYLLGVYGFGLSMRFSRHGLRFDDQFPAGSGASQRFHLKYEVMDRIINSLLAASNVSSGS